MTEKSEVKECGTCNNWRILSGTLGMCKWESPCATPWWHEREDFLSECPTMSNQGSECEVWEVRV